MPSPFPGMDPYLEGSLWSSVHSQFASEIARQLSPKLRPKYLALMTERFVRPTPEDEDVAVTSRDVYPDVGVAEAGPSRFAGQAVGIAAAPLRIATSMPEPEPQFTVEIRDRADRLLVTVIEVLSPSNKRSEDRKEYLAKRQRLLRSTAHLLEIDFLRAGQRVPMTRPLPPAPYFVFLSRAGQRPMTEVWPIPFDAPLPTVPVPLLPGDADVALDLQLALTTIYDACAFDLAVDDTRPPEVPLPPEAESWARARAILRAADPSG